MNRIILKVVENEEIYKNNNIINYASNIIGKSVTLTNEFIVVDELIAQGGYGTVYKCHTNHSSAALKKLCVNSVKKLLICIQEIHILKVIDSEHIMRYIDSIIYQNGTDIYDIFILTELYRGNLSSMMRTMRTTNRLFDEAMIVHTLSHVVKAVACLHQALPMPIIHRDLKVENVLIAYPQRYVLCDFGSATLKEVRPCDCDKQDLQEEISQCTTLSYRSPEMTDLYFDNGEHTIGRKSDIWAFGVMMYNICFFTLPFGESVLSIMSGNFTVPDFHDYSNDLMKLLKLCLTTNPDERPDIYQLSAIVFSLLHEPNPVKNAETYPTPCLDDLPLPLKESEAKAVSSSRIKKDRNANIAVFNKPVSTSIKPRERPKASDKGGVAPPRTTQSNSSSASSLTFKQSQSKVDQTDEWSMNQSSISVLTNTIDSCSITTSKADDLIDFNGAANHKINQMGNISKSQSLGKQFSLMGTGQYWNMHQMISQSYQNVPCVPHQLYSSTPPNNQTVYNNSHIPQFSYPAHPIGQQQFYPINHTNHYSAPMNMGHRRLVSEPMGFVSSSQNATRKIGCQPQTISSSQGILQPSKLALPITKTTALNEFDPLSN